MFLFRKCSFFYLFLQFLKKNEDYAWSYVYMSCLMTKQTMWHVRPAKTQISLGIRPVWSESSLSAWRKLRSLATHWALSEDSDQTGRMPRLIWVFARHTLILLVLSWGASYNNQWKQQLFRIKAMPLRCLHFLQLGYDCILSDLWRRNSKEINWYMFVFVV